MSRFNASSSSQYKNRLGQPKNLLGTKNHENLPNPTLYNHRVPSIITHKHFWYQLTDFSNAIAQTSPVDTFFIPYFDSTARHPFSLQTVALPQYSAIDKLCWSSRRLPR
jgi:hypothetical protein